MAAKYLIRFDDICPTMDWAIWDRVEKILLNYGVKPILAVVPDNRDPSLVSQPPRNEFWQRVRNWQSMGWAIGLHGYQHLYETSEAGLVGINTRSEFAGLPRERQYDKLIYALDIFKEQGVRADTWVAPAHSFDAITVKILEELGVSVISDGYYLRPVRKGGALWIPQQLWRFRSFPFGTWTVCFHANHFKEADFTNLEKSLKHFKMQIITLEEVVVNNPAKPAAMSDEAFAAVWRMMIFAKRLTHQYINRR